MDAFSGRVLRDSWEYGPVRICTPRIRLTRPTLHPLLPLGTRVLIVSLLLGLIILSVCGCIEDNRSSTSITAYKVPGSHQPSAGHVGMSCHT